MLRCCNKEPEGFLVPPLASKKDLFLRAMCILGMTSHLILISASGSEFCERLAYYSIASNLVLFFMNSLGYEKGTANIVTLVWSGALMNNASPLNFSQERVM